MSDFNRPQRYNYQKRKGEHKRCKNAQTVGAVTHTHTHTPVFLNKQEISKVEIPLLIVTDYLVKIACHFCVQKQRWVMNTS